jgi:transcriptional regulator with XRE-family HTH domain
VRRGLTEGADLGVVLRLVRQWQNWTQLELAQRIGISPVQIGKLERAEIDRPRPYTWERLRWGLGLEPDAVARIAARWRALEAQTHREFRQASVDQRIRPRDPGPYEIFGATF